MNLTESKINNYYNILKLEQYFGLKKKLQRYFFEIDKDKNFLKEITHKIKEIRTVYNYKKGIFRKKKIKNIHEFAFMRILIYVLIRHFKPKKILETGVHAGGNTAFILRAVYKNYLDNKKKSNVKKSVLSIDLPDFEIRKKLNKKYNKRHPLVKNLELYDEALKPGFIIPEKYKKFLTIKLGDSLKVLKKIKIKFDFYIHDSEHSFSFLKKELNIVDKKTSKKSVIIADDIDWSNAFYNFCSNKKYYPILFSDNGKDNLRTRIGLVYKNHKNNSKINFTK